MVPHGDFYYIKTRRYVSLHEQSVTSVCKSHYVIWCASDNLTQLFQRDHRDVLVLFQRIQSLIVNAGFQQLILSDSFCLHRFP